MMVGLLEEFELAVEVLFLDWLLTKGMLLIILICGLLLLLLVDDDVEGKDLLEAGTALTALTAALTAWDLWLLPEEATEADLTADSVGWWLLVPSERLLPDNE
jgi:hypothetical protein